MVRHPHPNKQPRQDDVAVVGQRLRRIYKYSTVEDQHHAAHRVQESLLLLYCWRLLRTIIPFDAVLHYLHMYPSRKTELNAECLQMVTRIAKKFS